MLVGFHFNRGFFGYIFFKNFVVFLKNLFLSIKIRHVNKMIIIMQLILQERVFTFIWDLRTSLFLVYYKS